MQFHAKRIEELHVLSGALFQEHDVFTDALAHLAHINVPTHLLADELGDPCLHACVQFVNPLRVVAQLFTHTLTRALHLIDHRVSLTVPLDQPLELSLQHLQLGLAHRVTRLVISLLNEWYP
jgi:hypothetical protein